MDKAKQIEKIQKMTQELLVYSNEYYNLDNPTISDLEYDEKFDTLRKLEDEVGYFLSNSPTREVQGKVLDGFEKVKHSKPMLSADKTKDCATIAEFLRSEERRGGKEC